MANIEAWLRRAPLHAAAIWLCGAALVAFLMPIDASYDILHYHLHNGWSAWEGRLARDLAPAGMHSYVNPVHNLFVEACLRYLPAGLITLLLGVLHGAVLIPLYMLCRRVLGSVGHDSAISAALLALAGFSSYSVLNVVASLRNDHWIAAAFLCGLLILVPRSGEQVSWRRAGAAAFLVGLSVGLKLTAIVHVAGLAAAVLVAVPGWKARAAAALSAAFAGLAGILVTGGWWAWKLWSELGNPIFPMANGLFKSPFAPPENFRDPRSLPDSLTDVLLFPFNGPNRFNEYDTSAMQDLPLALLYLAILIWIVLARSWMKAGDPPLARPSRALVTVFAAVLATLAVWFPLFAIGRYVMSVWMLSPLLFASTLVLVWPAIKAPQRAGLWFGAICVLCVVAGNTIALRRTPPPDFWGRYVQVEPPAAIRFDDALVLFTGSYPTSFLAPHLPSTATFTFALTADWTEPAERRLNRLVRKRIKAFEGPLVAVMLDMGETEGPKAVGDMLARLEAQYGLVADAGACDRFFTSFDSDLEHWIACPLSPQS